MKDTQSLTRAEYFIGQTLFQCFNSRLAELPVLPPDLKELNCYENQLAVLPETLPPGLTWLECDDNQLMSLPALPPGLIHLSCANNQIAALPEALPPGLVWLVCGNNLLTELPGILPHGLVKLLCHNNRLVRLPALPPGLKSLMCSNNELTSLPMLPAALTTLSCHSNQLALLPMLPAGLKSLNVWGNLLEMLPALPGELKELFCGYNKFVSLPALPAGLNKLSCDANQLTKLPALPDSLTWLSCSQNQMTGLDVTGLGLHYLNCSYNNMTDPADVKGFTGTWDGVSYIFYPQNPTGPDDITASFSDPNFRTAVYESLGKAAPAPIMKADVADVLMLNVSDREIQSLAGLEHFTGLSFLFCENNQLTELPETLPSGLKWLFCGNNQLTALPEALPSGLDWLYCYENQLTALPALPRGLTELNCGSNRLGKLPALPDSLTGLFCNDNLLTALPETLPSSLKWLSCDKNLLTTLSGTLPSGLSGLYCNGNKFAWLPKLPASLTSLYCYNNLLTELPVLPTGLTELDCDGNQIVRLPKLPSSLYRLNCARNRLTALDMTGLDKLEYLNCSYNNVSEPSAILGLPSTIWDDVNFIFGPQPEPVDKTALTAAIAAFEAEPKPADWIHNALINGTALRDKDDAIQANVDGATAVLSDIIPAVSLVQAIDVWCRRFEDLIEEDYTPESWEAAQAACITAVDVCADPDATRAAITSAWNQLYGAVTGLVFVPRLKPAATQPGTVPLRVGQTYQLKLDTNLAYLTFTPSNESVSVSETGLLKCVKPGISDITVRLASKPGPVLHLVVVGSN